MTDNIDESRRIADAVNDAGLQKLMELEPELVTRSWRLARTYGELLGRPDAPQREPAHIYQLSPDDE
jgi:hypothetical protein